MENNKNNNNLKITFSPGQCSTTTTKSLKINEVSSMARNKPGPNSGPKISRECTECGKKFLSLKALFGHMRCHPERQWRGINPPPSFRRCRSTTTVFTEEEYEVANCLLLLANQKTGVDEVPDPDLNVVLFECSSCKRVFGSFQALGGHRASHKNVKGCYAITKNVEEEEDEGFCGIREAADVGIMRVFKCGFCSRVFSSGEGLEGHYKRCHDWEKEANRVCSGFDLNLPAAAVNVDADYADDDDDHETSTSNYCSDHQLSLDLRLGL